MTSPKPRYQQLKDRIILQISTGELKPADRVPSENELVATMRVSRMTANRVLRELTDEGYVERIAGRGTFVSDFGSRSDVLEVHDIADEIAARGNIHSCIVLRQQSEAAAGNVAAALQLSDEEDVFHLQIVHVENNAPIQFEDRYVSIGFAPDLLAASFGKRTPSAYLTAIAPLQEAEQAVRAIVPDADIRHQLRMHDDEACLVVVRRTWAAGRPVSFAHLYHPGSRFELTGHYIPPGTSRSATADAVRLENLRI